MLRSPLPIRRGVVLLQAVTGDEQVGLGHSKDVMDGSGCQDLPHRLVDDIWVLSGLDFHGSQETHDEELVQDGVCEHRALHNIRQLFLTMAFSKGLKSLSGVLRSVFGSAYLHCLQAVLLRTLQTGSSFFQ